MATSLFGWDLLFKSVESDIKNNQDILVCLAHLVLVTNGFKCIGLGESKTLDGSENKSESLPANWNEDYAIRYVFQGKLYNFKATPMDDGIMINLVRVDERSVSLVQLNTRSVSKNSGTLDEMIPDNKNIVDLIKKQLIDKVVISKKSRDTSSQTENIENNPHSHVRDIRSTGSFQRGINPLQPALPSYGESDLDPLGGFNPLRNPPGVVLPGGGGNLFSPPRPSFPAGNVGIPHGSLPPGARFDPFRPPDVDRIPPRRPHNRPDNDEFPPPGYDDMFM